MKTYLYPLLVCFFQFPTAYAQWNDSFDDQNFKVDPVWNGDTSKFEINSSGQLHLNAPAVTGKACLFTSSRITTQAEWRCWIGFDFNPSSSNYAKVYLMSDQNRLDTALNGYYLRIGGTNDNICLYLQTGMTSKLLFASSAGLLNTTTSRTSLLVQRDALGKFTLSCDSTGETNYKLLGSVTDTTLWNSGFFGITCIYTSTRSRGFLFDDFVVTGKASLDSISPVIVKCRAKNDTTLDIKFSEMIDPSQLNTIKNYHVNGEYEVAKIVQEDDFSCKLFLSKPLVCDQPLSLSVSHMLDLAGNQMGDTTLEVTFCPVKIYDMLISEIMADPEPEVGLPPVEFLELWNQSGHDLFLDNWTLQVGTDRKIFQDCKVPGDSFLIITTKGGCERLHPSSQCIEMLGTYDLNNEGDYIGLRNSQNELIHWVNYTDSWYQDDLKASGGWSMEMIDPTHACLGNENWKACNAAAGGTPGKINSAKGEIVSELVFDYDKLFLPNDSVVRIYFNIPLKADQLDLALFSPEGLPPRKISADSLSLNYLDVTHNGVFLKGTTYHLVIGDQLSSCDGSRLSHNLDLPFQLPENAESGELLINEILFDALPGAPEFVEIYNHSKKYLSSKDYKMAYHNVGGNYEVTYSFGESPFLIPPQTFFVLTSRKNKFDTHYQIPYLRWLIENPLFPVLNNEYGVVAILNTSLQKLDEFSYASSLQDTWLVNTAGVSLERIRYSVAANDVENWHSAASAMGYATPGSENSQHLTDSIVNSEFWLEPEVFSPDNDGYEDITSVTYQMNRAGFAATMIVFDAEGRKIKLLTNNLPLGTEGVINWDGTNDQNQRVDTGIYLIYIEIHHADGALKKYKFTCVVAGDRRK